MHNDELDDLVTRLYRAAMSITDAGWQGLLKNAAFSLAAAQQASALVAESRRALAEAQEAVAAAGLFRCRPIY